MNFLRDAIEKAKPQEHGEGAEQENSNSELLASAKLVSEAAQDAFSGSSDKVDTSKVAGAAANLLDAAGNYGKLDEKEGVGKYLDQAEGYLRSYQGSHTTTTPTDSTGDQKTTTTTTATDESSNSGGEPQKEHPGNDEPKQEDTESGEPQKEHPGNDEPKQEDTESGEKSGSGYGDFAKLAGGFLK